MTNLTAVVPNRRCVIDGHGKDGFLLGSDTDQGYDIVKPLTDSWLVGTNPLEKLDTLAGWQGLSKEAWATEWFCGWK